MAKFLVHVTCGPEQPTRATLAFFVARAAVEEGHAVTVFLAGDAVQLLRDAVLDGLNGLGTGNLREHYGKIVEGGGKFVLSGASSKARGLGEADLAGKAHEMGSPHLLVRLALDHDRVINY
jgi:uncharacterized protein